MLAPGTVLLLAFELLLQGDADARVLQTFEARAAVYAEIHRLVEARMPPLDPSSDAARIARHQSDLATRMRAARPQAKQGDMFSSEIAARFRSILTPHFRGVDGARARAAMFEEMPPRVSLQVNEVYPAAVPLAIVPPRILSDLPSLPEELEYRFIGRYLILRDVHANMVVDFLPEVIP